MTLFLITRITASGFALGYVNSIVETSYISQLEKVATTQLCKALLQLIEAPPKTTDKGDLSDDELW